MFFNKVFKFYKGYVIIEIRGAQSERFINICTRRSIHLRDITAHEGGSITARAEARDFARMRSAAKKSGVRVHIIRKKTLRTVRAAAKYRLGFLIGLFAFVIFSAVSSGFIWKVEVVGNTITPTDRIIDAAAKAGLYQGVKKSAMPPVGTMKYIIMNETDTVSWAWVYINGSKATVRVREGEAPPPITDEFDGCDIIAAHDGMITSITVKKGIAKVKVGDGVSAGDILVSGLAATEFDEEGNPTLYRAVHADADITADTWYEQDCTYPLSYTTKTPTGAVKRRYTLTLFAKSIPLWKNTDPPFEEYESQAVSHELSLFGKFLGISLDEEIFSEYSVYSEPLSEESAAELAKSELEEQITQKLTSGAVLLDEDISWIREGDSIHVTLTMRFSQNIAAVLPHKRSEQFDTTND